MLKHLMLAVALLAVSLEPARAEDQPWAHSGSLFILTTPDGADLPASCSEADFPLLVRFTRDNFDFSQVKPTGDDIRFSDGDDKPLAYQIEQWDATAGRASIWVRIPLIKGNAAHEIKLRWGNANADSESNGAAVFNESNGYLSVWHMNEPVKDVVGTLPSKDDGTTAVAGIVGGARHFPGGHGIFGGEKIPDYPSGKSPHSSEAWFRAQVPNATILGWGNEGGGRGSKVRMQLRSPPHVHIDSDFSDVNGTTPIAMSEWTHVVHTYDASGTGRIYIDGQLDNATRLGMDIKSPARLWIGGWYNNYDFVGDIDEVRISKVARSADWVRLEYENQKPMQTLVGTLPQAGNAFSVSSDAITVDEGKRAKVTGQAGGAQKVYWIVKRDGAERVIATDQFTCNLNAGRVVGDSAYTLQFKAVYGDGVKTRDIAVNVKEMIPEPVLKLTAPEHWNGRDAIEAVANVSNLDQMKAAGAGDLHERWTISGGAVTWEAADERLILKRSQFTGPITASVSIDNGGVPTVATCTIAVAEPAKDPWIQRTPPKDEEPEDGQFYARDDRNEGTLYDTGILKQRADAVFLRIFADDKPFASERCMLGLDKSYSFTLKLKPGLIKYRTELGTSSAGVETIVHSAKNLVCGDAYLIEGQSNALATDTGEKSPPETSEWIRSYSNADSGAKGNGWCNPVWKAEHGEKAELGWWGMDLARRLVASDQMPIFIINAAVGGTRIDQHQPNAADPTDLSTIYGRMLWRVQHAKMTHGIRAVIWHQGESDQGADGPTGGYGSETYQQYFLNMSAAWKQDMPNIQHYYIFQIWPNSCAMGNGHGNKLREVQRDLPKLFSHMDILSTLGVKPAGGCHYPLIGWSEFARMLQPLFERDNHSKAPAGVITPPNLRRAGYVDAAKDTVALEFDQPVMWNEALASEFYLDSAADQIASGSVSGQVLTLKLKQASTAKTITYLKEMHWSQDHLLLGANGMAALTFCEVPVEMEKSR